MANQQHLSLLKQGAERWNPWIREVFNKKGSKPDLSGADLSGADLNFVELYFTNLAGARFSKATLRRARFDGADLSGADLSEANLLGATLSLANLNGAKLNGAYLAGATLSGAHLRFAMLQGADLSAADLRGADLYQADLRGANLQGAIFVQANLGKATLTNCRVYGISAWDVELADADQSNLLITDSPPYVMADDLEMAQFIYLLINHKKLRNALNAVTKKGVLLLGRFGGGGLEVLQAIAGKLREEKYLPIIFDFERPQDHDYTETITTLVGLARFVIVDLSGPSVPQELSHTVPFFDIPFVPIIEKGRKSYAMFVDLLKYPWVLRPPIEFSSVEDLLARMPLEVIVPAEKRHQARQKLLDELFKKA
jgi:uncharacterized protein YjbI with pentapeptide repeats